MLLNNTHNNSFDYKADREQEKNKQAYFNFSCNNRTYCVVKYKMGIFSTIDFEHLDQDKSIQ